MQTRCSQYSLTAACIVIVEIVAIFDFQLSLMSLLSQIEYSSLHLLCQVIHSIKDF